MIGTLLSGRDGLSYLLPSFVDGIEDHVSDSDESEWDPAEGEHEN